MVRPATGRVRPAAATALCLLACVLFASPAHADGQAVHHAADHLLRSQLPTGLLRYDFDFLTGEPTGKDDIVRQAGVAAFMAAYYSDTHDPRMRSAVEAALQAFHRLSVPVSNGWWQPMLDRSGLASMTIGRRTVWQALDRIGLLYRPYGDGRVLTMDGMHGAAYTGATAMALLAELLYRDATEDDRYRSDRVAWLNGLLVAHIAERGFRSTPTDFDESPFYNGEAWLALSEYHRRYPHDESVARLLNRLDSYLMHRYAGDVGSGFYQWGTMAAAVRFHTTADRRFVDFIAQQATKALAEAPWSATRYRNTCHIVEGLATAATVLATQSSYSALARQVADIVDREMTKNQTFQIPPHVTRIAIADGGSLASSHLAAFAGAFLAGTARVYTRIDYTGHCLSAMLKRTAVGAGTARRVAGAPR